MRVPTFAVASIPSLSVWIALSAVVIAQDAGNIDSNDVLGCIKCTDKPSSAMVEQGETCQTTTELSTRCRDDPLWFGFTICQASCFNAGRGYKGDLCCADIGDNDDNGDDDAEVAGGDNNDATDTEDVSALSDIPPTSPSTGSPRTESPTDFPTEGPTDSPTEGPTDSPTEGPTAAPVTEGPTASPTKVPTSDPTEWPTEGPTEGVITEPPTSPPTPKPSDGPTPSPGPTMKPTMTCKEAPASPGGGMQLQCFEGINGQAPAEMRCCDKYKCEPYIGCFPSPRQAGHPCEQSTGETCVGERCCDAGLFCGRSYRYFSAGTDFFLIGECVARRRSLLRGA